MPKITMKEKKLYYTRCAWCHRWHDYGLSDSVWETAQSQPLDKVPSDTICSVCEQQKMTE